jgi:diguanylate cyclase (GGDEF)-like protein/PAS domain S-box-containing protein
MTVSRRLDPAGLDVVLDALLACNPRAPVTAINGTGFFVPMPPSVPLTGQHVIQGHATALELVVPADMKEVVDVWARTHEEGAAYGIVHLRNNPERPVTLRYVDARHRHGVFIGLLEVESSDGLLAAFQDMPALRPKVTMVRKNQTAILTQIDHATTLLLGWSADEMVGRRTLDFLDPEDHPRAISSWMDMLRAPGDRRRVRLRHRHKDGSWVWFEVTNHNLLNDPAHGYVLTEMVDISDEMAAHDALLAREHLLRRLTDALPLGILHVDDRRRIVYRNKQVAYVLGCRNAVSVDQQFASAVHSDRPRLKQALDTVLINGGDHDLEIGVKRRGREMLRCSVSLRALTTENGVVTGAIVSVADITDSARLRQELEERATFDVLTRCHNRASILSILDRTLSDAVVDRRGSAVIFIDLDGFKQLNDNLGHATGDAFLVEIAQRLQRAVRHEDKVGRLGGDEFLVVCREVESADRAQEIAERLAAEIEGKEVLLGTVSVHPRASIGVAWAAAGADADGLVARADAAMYEAKRKRLANSMPPAA